MATLRQKWQMRLARAARKKALIQSRSPAATKIRSVLIRGRRIEQEELVDMVSVLTSTRCSEVRRLIELGKTSTKPFGFRVAVEANQFDEPVIFRLERRRRK